MDSLNLAFVSIFTVEAGMKIIAQPKQYWRSKWNVFDFLIVVGSVGGIVLDYATSLRIGPLVRSGVPCVVWGWIARDALRCLLPPPLSSDTGSLTRC